MKYTFPVPSLERYALTRIASVMLNCELQTNELALPQNGFFPLAKVENDSWTLVERSLRARIENSTLPDRMKLKLYDAVRELFSQIWDWLEYGTRIVCKPWTNILKYLCWTSSGIIDKRRTLQLMMEQKVNNITKETGKLNHLTRYIELCYFLCFEECAVKLIKQSGKNTIATSDFQTKLYSYWTAFSRRCKVHSDSVLEKFLLCSCKMKSSLAAQYFWHQITDAERGKNAMICVHLAIFHKMTDFLCEILTCMSDERQILVFRKYHAEIIECFFQWPYDSFILPTLKFMMNYFTLQDFVYFLASFALKLPVNVREGNKWQLLLHTLWKEVPDVYKRLFSKNYELYLRVFFEQLIRAADMSTIKLVVDDPIINSKAVKTGLIRSTTIHQTLTNHIRANNHFVQNFLNTVFMSPLQINFFRRFVLEKRSSFHTPKKFKVTQSL